MEDIPECARAFRGKAQRVPVEDCGVPEASDQDSYPVLTYEMRTIKNPPVDLVTEVLREDLADHTKRVAFVMRGKVLDVLQ